MNRNKGWEWRKLGCFVFTGFFGYVGYEAVSERDWPTAYMMSVFIVLVIGEWITNEIRAGRE